MSAGRRGETSGFHAPAGRGEASGAHPAAVAQPSARRGEASGAYPVANRQGEASGAHPAAGRKGAPRTGSQPVARQPESAAERTEVITRHGETSGNYPITARSESSGSFRAASRGEAPPEGETETTGSRRGRRRTEAPAESENHSTGSRRRAETAEGETRSRRGGADATTELETPGRRRMPGRGDSTGPHRTAGKSETTGSHRTLGKGEATGSHRIVGKKAPRRRIAGWPIACAVLAALIGLGVIGWNWADSELNSRAEAQATSCSQGTSHMRIIVTPSVQKPMTAAADRWNKAATVVHGQCVHVMVEAKPSSQVLDALVGRSNLSAIGGLPAAWLPESSYWVSELTTKKPEMIGSPAQSVANARSADYPFIGLAGQGVDDTLLRAAQTFREYLEQPAQQADFAAAGIKST
ncbi:hypothetical protein M8542_04890 [Amycolatopsis sp. OK19-0408]|uniref:Extracellular solute-binding protein n=1 Tax=Amycolatopsis iheyensis TaxID=2945988 RepID=A0A9X2SGW6_9PSEU|nr:hypothetical protein [Amycolatopsis iheyensis]MCR6482137.1 hypothetical protein [Amycolatopsis iheyensis]